MAAELARSHIPGLPIAVALLAMGGQAQPQQCVGLMAFAFVFRRIQMCTVPMGRAMLFIHLINAQCSCARTSCADIVLCDMPTVCIAPQYKKLGLKCRWTVYYGGDE